MLSMTSLPEEPTEWELQRGGIERIREKQLSEETWSTLQELPAAVAPEVSWRLRALQIQLPAAGSTIHFQAIRPLPSSGEEPGRNCDLCGDHLPQTLTTQRFRCELCAIALRILLDYPVLYKGSRESLPALPG